jgi:DNA polymerase III subunit epsilon
VELTGGRQIGLGLADSAAAVELVVAESEEIIVHAARPIRAPRPHAAHSDELERHKAFVATLVNPVWESVSQSVDA